MLEDLYRKRKALLIKEGIHSWLDYRYPLLIIVHRSIPELSFKIDWKVSFPSIGRNRCRNIYIEIEIEIELKKDFAHYVHFLRIMSVSRYLEVCFAPASALHSPVFLPLCLLHYLRPIIYQFAQSMWISVWHLKFPLNFCVLKCPFLIILLYVLRLLIYP